MMVSLWLIVDLGQKIQLQGMNHGSLEEGISLWLFVTWLWKPCMAHRNDDKHGWLVVWNINFIFPFSWE